MGADLFGFLTGISPWWWVAFALALGVAEMATFTYALLWPGLAALSMGLVLFAVPTLAGSLQITGFAVLTVLYGAIGWLILRGMRPQPEPEPGLNRRNARLAGREAVVRGPFSAGIGPVEIDGVQWRGRLAEPGGTVPEPGEVVTVADVDGTTLILARKTP
ncbi:MAG: NfeD family protein [Pseudomonadota bacterium]